jgi:cytochrome c-type biogenesis protein CcmH
MIVFWIAAAVLSALAALLVLYRAARLARLPAGDPTLEVYRRQLDEIDDLAERGLLADSERRAARAEAARRLLSAADPSQQVAVAAADGKFVRAWVVLGAVAAPLAALGLYLALGSPGLPDQPFAARLAAWRNVADPRQLTPGQLVAVLEEAVKRQPDDPQGRLLLARVQAAAGGLPAAAQTLKTAARLAPGRAEIWAALGEVLVQQAQGQETADAVDAFRRALALDPQAASARYHLGRAKIMSGDVQGGLNDWRALAATLSTPEDVQALNAQIEATQRAGRLMEPDAAQQQQAQPESPAEPAGPGPSSDQVQAAQQALAGAAPADQRAFIQSMVDGLAAKLKADPGDWRSWALLVHSYGVLGQADRQADAYAQAAKRFAADPVAMKALDEARAPGPTP